MKRFHLSEDLAGDLDSLKRERARERGRRWRTAHREELVEYYRRYRAEHPELAEYYAARYRAQHGPAVAERRATRQTGRPAVEARARELRLASQARWRERHREQVVASVAAAKAKKPEYYREINRARTLRRRARLAASPVEKFSVRAIVERDCGLCHLCRGAVDRATLTLDHLIPVVRGGATAAWNLALAHRRCNQRRGTRALFEPETKEMAELYVAEASA